MKITDPDVIKNGEKDLIDSVKKDLDLDAVKEIIKKRMAAGALSSKGGEIIVHNNEIAFRMDFEIQLSGSLMFDRQGNYIPEADESEDQENILSEDLDLDDMEDTPEEEELNIDLPDYGLDDPEELSTDAGSDPEIERNDAPEDSLVDDDMDDILKESREFWEPKKDS